MNKMIEMYKYLCMLFILPAEFDLSPNHDWVKGLLGMIR